jgi:hypothetical protein
MAATKKDHEAIAADVVKALPKAQRDRIEVSSKAGMTNLKADGQIVAAVRTSGIRVFFPAAGSEDQVKAALAHVVKERASTADTEDEDLAKADE